LPAALKFAAQVVGVGMVELVEDRERALPVLAGGIGIAGWRGACRRGG
jgi:hypothetical protein